MLRKLSFIIAILGIGVLLGLLLSPAEEIESLEELEINERVVFSGKVESEKDFGGFKIWKIRGFEMDVVCDCEESYLNEEIEIEGIVDEFNGKKQVRVLVIEKASR